MSPEFNPKLDINERELNEQVRQKLTNINNNVDVTTSSIEHMSPDDIHITLI